LREYIGRIGEEGIVYRSEIDFGSINGRTEIPKARGRLRAVIVSLVFILIIFNYI
jgi:hypothetical protein